MQITIHVQLFIIFDVRFQLITFLFAGRSGHSLTRLGLSKTALMFGGATGNYKRKLGTAFLPPSEECFDCSFYTLDLDSYTWKDVGPIDGMMPRCHHSASYLEGEGGSSTVVFVGGMQYVGFSATHRLPLEDIHLLHINQHEGEVQLALEKVKIDVPPDEHVFLSFHSADFIGKKLFVWGGYVQPSSSIEGKGTSRVSDSMFILNLEEKTAAVQHGDTPGLFTAGGSVIPITDDVLLIAGGTSAQFSIFTTRDVECAECVLEDKCRINELDNNINELVWVQCSRRACEKWYHLFCVGLVEAPAGDYYCPKCS